MVTLNQDRREQASSEPGVSAHGQWINIGDIERIASTLGGGAIALGGLIWCPSAVGKLVSAAIGGALIYRGVSGHCHLYGAMKLSTADRPREQVATTMTGSH